MPSRFKYFVLVLVLLAVAPGLGDELHPTSGPVDLEKTRELFRSWVARKSFPDSITLAYYHAYSLEALEGAVTPGTRDRIVAFVKRCQREDGGFVSNPQYGSGSNIVYTYYALATLRRLGADDAVDRDKVLDFVRGLVQENGGIRPTPDPKNSPSLAATFFGVQALQLLGRLDVVDPDNTAAFVLTHRSGEDAFGMTPTGGDSPRAVSMAVRTLSALERLGDKLRTGATGYLENAIALMGTRGPRFRALSSMQTAADILAALEEMGVLQDVITEQLLQFVVARYIPDNGGFGPAPGLGTTPPSTYQGLYCLATLEKLPRSAVPAPSGSQESDR